MSAASHLATVARAAEDALPYASAPTLRMGEIQIHAFGLLVAAGILAGATVAALRARRLGLDQAAFAAATLWTVVGGLAAAHVVEVVAYHPRAALERPWELLRLGDGLSSFGGFAGAAVAFALSARHRLPLLAGADALATGLPVGWLFGRTGCALAHDHPGVRSGSWIAVAYPDGARLDLGLLELAVTPLLVAVVMLAGRHWRRPGCTMAALAVAYALLRFPLEFLRAPEAEGGDLRLYGLTPGHAGAALLLAAGIAVARRARRIASPLDTAG